MSLSFLCGFVVGVLIIVVLVLAVAAVVGRLQRVRDDA